MTTVQSDKVREVRLRQMASRRGFTVAKCRRRDPLAVGYGTYEIRNARTDMQVLGDRRFGYGLTLDDVEDFLNVR